jgi:hypothetical protein
MRPLLSPPCLAPLIGVPAPDGCTGQPVHDARDPNRNRSALLLSLLVHATGLTALALLAPSPFRPSDVQSIEISIIIGKQLPASDVESIASTPGAGTPSRGEHDPGPGTSSPGKVGPDDGLTIFRGAVVTGRNAPRLQQGARMSAAICGERGSTRHAPGCRGVYPRAARSADPGAHPG